MTSAETPEVGEMGPRPRPISGTAGVFWASFETASMTVTADSFCGCRLIQIKETRHGKTPTSPQAEVADPLAPEGGSDDWG
jgi:hypothetical protein